MRRELAFAVAEVLSVIPGALISTLGDGRAQYGYALLLVGLPIYCFAVTLFLLPIFGFIESRQSRSQATYFLATTFVVLSVFAIVWLAEVGIVGSLALAASVGAAFLLTAWLTGAVRRA